MRSERLENAHTAGVKGVSTLKLSVFVQDLATVSVGTLLATILGILQVFIIPRIVTVETFGYWRLFLLYNSFAGLLHLGFADGALLRWAGREFYDIRPEVPSSLKFLGCQQLAILPCLGLIVITALPLRLRAVGVGLLVFAAVFNVTALLQYSLQAARQFKLVAVASTLPMGVFVLLAVLWTRVATPNVSILIALFIVGWSCVLIVYWIRIRPFSHKESVSASVIGRRLLALGWPIALSNTVYGLIQTVDRLAVSSIFSINEFAQYSFAASALFIPITAITAGSQVFFPHIAAVEEGNRTKAYSSGSLLLVIAWGLSLPYYFILQIFVRNFLPKYEPGLPAAMVLMFSVLFLGGIQILQGSFFNIYGLQRSFLKSSIAALLVGLCLVLAAALRFKSLTVIAIAQVLTLALWWQFNEWKLKEVTGQSIRDWVRTACLFSWSGLSFWAAASVSSKAVVRVGFLYVLLAIGITLIHPRGLLVARLTLLRKLRQAESTR